MSGAVVPGRALFAFIPLLVGLAGCKAPSVVSVTPRSDETLDSGQNVGSADDGPRGGDAGFSLAPPDATFAMPPPTMSGLDCAGAAKAKGNAGCSFFATPVPVKIEGTPRNCEAMFVVNPGAEAAKLTLARAGKQYPLAQVARLPRGGGQSLTYEPFDEARGLPPGEIAIVFLAAGPCPPGIRPALEETNNDDGLDPVRGEAFHLTTDKPVVSYHIVPYGGAGSHVTSATLLLPREAWGTNYIAATPTSAPFAYVLVTAAEDGTEVTLRPSGDVAAGGGVPGAAGGAMARITLAAGQFARFRAAFTVFNGLSGSVVTSNKPVSVIGGTPCFNMPVNKSACDSAHQQIPPLEALGHEYVAVRYRNRVPGMEESTPWQLVGAAEGTTLTYQPARPQGAPATLRPGQMVEFFTPDPFVVSSQDAQHPFYVAGYMIGFTNVDQTTTGAWPGDPEFVNVVPAAQFLSSYVFFTDPTYPDTSLVVVRKRGDDGQFADVRLGCQTAPLTGWAPVGDFQFTRVDLVTGNFQPAIPGCDNGRQSMTSKAPFGVTVWGWGSQLVKVGGEGTGATSYAYPAGASIHVTNTIRPPL